MLNRVVSRRIAHPKWNQRRMNGNKIFYTFTDEAPMLATYSLLPIIRRFTNPAKIDVELSDISVAARIISHFPEDLSPEQRLHDSLGQLGDLAKKPDANIIKLPNVSASLPQLLGAIAELQSQGYNIPSYPTDPKTDEEKETKLRYAKVLGSAVNPVLREGNSDRRVAAPVKAYAQKNPVKLGAWSKDSKTHVSHMTKGDFLSSEQSTIITNQNCSVSIQFISNDGNKTILKSGLALQYGEVIDASVMSVKELRSFFEKEINDAYKQDILLSLHLKATMMKISDPIMFGHAVEVYFKDAFEKHGETFKKIGVNVNNGLGDVYEKVNSKLPKSEADIVIADIEACYTKQRPRLAMVNSAKGITNLHVPSDVIIDASMPNVVRDSGGMWNKDNKLEATKALIPDRSYAGIYQAILEDCKKHGAFNVSTMGNVANIGLMAQKAEEYGSHDKTFEIQADGVVHVVDNNGKKIFEHNVQKGDIWRMCQTKDEPIKDWVKLAMRRANEEPESCVAFWLDPERAHDRSLMQKVDEYLPKDHGQGISVMSPVAGMKLACERARAGKNTITVTGNVLRDYLTDLFPILELGTSAKMLSIVPLLAGGALFETGAGGSAPKHVEQFVEEGHLRWDSLGEYLALTVSLEHLAKTQNNEKAKLLGDTLTVAIGKLLDNRKSPSRKVKELDNRGSNFYIALYWAEAMAKHDNQFKKLAEGLKKNEEKIVKELIDCQGKVVDIGGYYKPDHVKANLAMRPSLTFNNLVDE